MKLFEFGDGYVINMHCIQGYHKRNQIVDDVGHTLKLAALTIFCGMNNHSQIYDTQAECDQEVERLRKALEEYQLETRIVYRINQPEELVYQGEEDRVPESKL